MAKKPATKKPAKGTKSVAAAVRAPAKKASPARPAAAKPSRPAARPAARAPAPRGATTPRTAERKAAAPATRLPKMGENFGQFLVDLIQENHGTTGVAAKSTVRTAFEALDAALRRPKAAVKIPGLGIAQNVRKAARNHKNPRTGEIVKKGAHNSVRVKVTRGLRTVG